MAGLTADRRSVGGAVPAGPYVSPFAAASPAPVRLPSWLADDAAAPFAPRDPTATSHPSLDARGATGRQLRRRTNGRRRVEEPARQVGYEEWGGGVAVGGAVYSVHADAPPVRPASPVADRPVDARARAADHLEAVARRVRSGELVPLGLTPTMTEAGALAATLAALLTPAP